MDLIIIERVNRGAVVIPEIGLDEVPSVYEKFNKRAETYEGRNHSSE
jgi:hypothetical protein